MGEYYKYIVQQVQASNNKYKYNILYMKNYIYGAIMIKDNGVMPLIMITITLLSSLLRPVSFIYTSTPTNKHR